MVARMKPNNTNIYIYLSLSFFYDEGKGGAVAIRICDWNLFRTGTRTSSAGNTCDNKNRCNLINSRSWGQSNQLSMGIPLLTWYPKAWGELSTNTVRRKSRPKTFKSFKKLPSTARHDSRNKRWCIHLPSVDQSGRNRIKWLVNMHFMGKC